MNSSSPLATLFFSFFRGFSNSEEGVTTPTTSLGNKCQVANKDSIGHPKSSSRQWFEFH